MHLLMLAGAMLVGVEATAHATQIEPSTARTAAQQTARYHGVLIRVPDLDQALRFYGDALGFQFQRISPQMARLADSTPIYLEQVSHKLRPPEDDEARAAVAFQTRDIAAATARLRAKGVTFLSERPIDVGIGLANRFRDPFGNIHALLQQTAGQVPSFDEPKVYNSGFKHPDADTAALRQLFGKLGFKVRTERYYPPSLPLGHADGSFAFMLHENEPEEPEVRARTEPLSAAVSLIFETANLQAVRGHLPQPGKIREFPLGRRIRATVPSGVPVEFWQR